LAHTTAHSTLSPRTYRLETLIRSAHRLINRLTQPEADALGLTLPRLWVLVHVDECPRLTMGALARRMGLSRSAVTGLVDDMVRSGLVRREDDPDDRRIIRLALTPDGEAALRRLLARRAQVVADALHQVSEAEAEALLAGLERLVDRMQAMAEGTLLP